MPVANVNYFLKTILLLRAWAEQNRSVEIRGSQTGLKGKLTCRCIPKFNWSISVPEQSKGRVLLAKWIIKKKKASANSGKHFSSLKGLKWCFKGGWMLDFLPSSSSGQKSGFLLTACWNPQALLESRHTSHCACFKTKRHPCWRLYILVRLCWTTHFLFSGGSWCRLTEHVCAH